MSKSYFLVTNQLNEVETGVVTSIINHIEKGEKKISIAQIASENFVSTAFIVKMSKKLGFNGYTDMVYKLAQDSEPNSDSSPNDLQSLIDNYDCSNIEKFLRYLYDCRDRKIFVVGAGFADITADYIAQRLSVCGFMVFNRVHFYDYMLFRDTNVTTMNDNIDPSLIIAISQSGETETVINDVMRAKQNDFKVITFTKMKESTLANLSDIIFLIDSERQALVSPVPNHFFGKIILTIEEMMALYFNEINEK